MEFRDNGRGLLFLIFLVFLSASHSVAIAETPASIVQNAAAPAFRERGIQAYDFDFDDNIFSTKARVYVTNARTGRKKGVSTAYWAVVRQKLGKEGGWKDYVLDPRNGLDEFNDSGPAGEDLFKKQIEEGRKTSTRWAGRASLKNSGAGTRPRASPESWSIFWTSWTRPRYPKRPDQ